MEIRLCYGEDENKEKGRFIAVFPTTEYRLNVYSELIGKGCSLLGYEFTAFKDEDLEFLTMFKKSLFKCLKRREWDTYYIEHLLEQIQVIESSVRLQKALKENCKRYHYKNLFQLIAETIRCMNDKKIPELLKYSFEELEEENQRLYKKYIFKKSKRK